MPGWKIHLILALLLSVLWMKVFDILNFSLNFLEIFLMLFFMGLFSLLPDIDMNNSKIRKIVSFGVAIMISIAYIVYKIQKWYLSPIFFFLIFNILKHLPMKHRGITHTLFFGFMLSIMTGIGINMIVNPFGSLMEGIILWSLLIMSSYFFHILVDNI